MNALEIDRVGIAFGSVPVLDDVSLLVPERSLTAVLGASGSGKTTLLRIVAGFEQPQRGAIRLAGRWVDGRGRHVPPERRRLGYVAQDGALFPHLTVARNIGFGMRRGLRSTRIDELLELVGLSGLGRRYPHELSGGQQQRVALARALAVRPDIVLLDEPFSSLDAALRASVRAEITRVLRQAATAAVLVTHDQQEALSLADRVAVLRDGRIAQSGTPRDLYLRPVDTELARFLGDANLVPAHVRGHVVTTELGVLSTECDVVGPAVALVRPEQVELTQDLDHTLLTGTVRAHSYQGHDSVVTVIPDRPCGTEHIVARVAGDAVYRPGSRVGIRAAGPAMVWSDRVS